MGIFLIVLLFFLYLFVDLVFKLFCLKRFLMLLLFSYKVAVAMPNLDELLKDTPTHAFASVWLEWKNTKFYPTHYSELVRLAALYK